MGRSLLSVIALLLMKHETEEARTQYNKATRVKKKRREQLTGMVMVPISLVVRALDLVMSPRRLERT